MEKTIWDIDCPFCQKRMGMIDQSASQNSTTGMQYVRTRYNCPHCDFWLKTEIPRRIAEKHQRQPLPPPVVEAVS